MKHQSTIFTHELLLLKAIKMPTAGTAIGYIIIINSPGPVIRGGAKIVAFSTSHVQLATWMPQHVISFINEL
jgi:hypothetical protein